MLRKPLRIAIGTSVGVIAAGATVSAIIIPLALQKKYKVQYWENGDPLQSLNYVTRGTTASSPIYGFYMEGLVKSQAPQSVKSVILNSLQKRKWTVPYTHDGKIISKPGGYATSSVMMYISQQKISKTSFDPKTGDPLFTNFDDASSALTGSDGNYYDIAMADILEYYLGNTDISLRARIQENAMWSNGEKVTAQDFVQTLKYILNLKNASILLQKTYEILKLRGAKELMDLQNHGMSFEKAWAKLKSENKLPVTVDGTDNRWVHYHFNKSAPNIQILADYLGGDIFFPTNKKFVDSIGGILNYGQTKKTVLSNGPYKIDELDLDYMATFSKNPNYYEKETVFLDHPAYKVSPSQAIQMKLFKSGKLSNINILPEFMFSFYSDPKLASLIQHGASAPATSGIMFSKRYTDLHPNSPSADKDFRKAVQYGIDRNIYAAYKNASGSAPANTIYTARNSTKVFDSYGKTYYDYLLDKEYKEIDPISNNTKGIKFYGYDRKSQYESYYAEINNNEYKDYMYDKVLANHFLESYLKRSHKKSVTLDVLITAAEENSFLGLKEALRRTFGNKINVEAKLVAPQIMTENQFKGDFMLEFKTLATSIVDPWGVYSYFEIEDGYNEDKNNKPYLDLNKKESMELTSRYWTNPGFEIRDYIKTLSNNDKTRLGINNKDIKAWNEAATRINSKELGKRPIYKYSNDQTLILSPEAGGNTKFNGNDVPSSLSPYFASEEQRQNDWIFKTNDELFDWYYKTEKVLKDAAYNIPLLSSSSNFFADRRGLRTPGNTQSLPYGYQFIYPKDNNELINKIENDIRKRLNASISLERL